MKKVIAMIIFGILFGCTISLPITIAKYEKYVNELRTEIYEKNQIIDSLSRRSDLTAFEIICLNKSSKKSNSNE